MDLVIMDTQLIQTFCNRSGRHWVMDPWLLVAVG